MDAPNLGQILHLMNNAGINSRIANKEGRVAKLLDPKAKLPDVKVVEDLYLATVSRFPTPEESKKAISMLIASKEKQKTGEDLLWALMNSNEFIFNH